MTKHLAIFTKDVTEQIFLGKKTIETRFSLKKIAPFGQIRVGDIVYIKPSGEDIQGQFEVKKVIFFEGLDQNDWQLIKNNYGKDLSLGSPKKDEEFFKLKNVSMFGTIIFIDKVEKFLTSPVKIEKKDNRGWMVL